MIKTFAAFLLFISLSFSQEEIIIDSDISLEEALSGKDIPTSVTKDLALVSVEYFSFDGKLHRGQIVIHKKLAEEIKLIFSEIKQLKFPVEKVIPVSLYNWDDELSMLDNNTSSFNYRVVKGTKKLSAHSTGRAIDINPFLNPQIKRGKIFPDGAEYNPKKKGSLTQNSPVVKLFKKLGWQWGGNWRSTKDYQHFEK